MSCRSTFRVCKIMMRYTGAPKYPNMLGCSPYACSMNRVQDTWAMRTNSAAQLHQEQSIIFFSHDSPPFYLRLLIFSRTLLNPAMPQKRKRERVAFSNTSSLLQACNSPFRFGLCFIFISHPSAFR